MRESKLLVSRIKHLAKRRPLKPKPVATAPNQIWGTDMTKVMIPSYGWVYLTIVLDWYTKKIVGYRLGIQSKTRDWLEALRMAVNNQFPDGIRQHLQLCLVSDNGLQPALQGHMKECAFLGIKRIFASYNNPKGNAGTERVIRTIKEDLVRINGFACIAEFKEKLDIRVGNHNNDYPHSSIGYKTPSICKTLYFSKTGFNNKFFPLCSIFNGERCSLIVPNSL